MRCPACDHDNLPQATHCAECGQKLTRRRRGRDDDEDLEAEESARLSPFSLSSAAFRNMKALVAFYLGVFGLIPVVGLMLGPTAVVLGVLGLRYARTHPGAKGNGHALAGVVLGGLEFLFNGAGMIFLLIGLSAK